MARASSTTAIMLRETVGNVIQSRDRVPRCSVRTREWRCILLIRCPAGATVVTSAGFDPFGAANSFTTQI